MKVFYITDSTGKKTLHGRDIEIIKAISEVLDFNIVFIEPKPGEHASQKDIFFFFSTLVLKLIKCNVELFVYCHPSSYSFHVTH